MSERQKVAKLVGSVGEEDESVLVAHRTFAITLTWDTVAARIQDEYHRRGSEGTTVGQKKKALNAKEANRPRYTGLTGRNVICGARLAKKKPLFVVLICQAV